MEMNKYIYHLCCAQQFELTTNSPKNSMYSAQSMHSYTGNFRQVAKKEECYGGDIQKDRNWSQK